MSIKAGLRALALGVAMVCGAATATQAALFYTTLTGTSGDLPVEMLLTTHGGDNNIRFDGVYYQIASGSSAVFTQTVTIGETSYRMSPFDYSGIRSLPVPSQPGHRQHEYSGYQYFSSSGYHEIRTSIVSDKLPVSLDTPINTIAVTGSGSFNCRHCVLDAAGQIIFGSSASRSFTIHTASVSLTPPSFTPVPGAIAGTGLPTLLGLGGFVWMRWRKAAVVA